MEVSVRCPCGVVGEVGDHWAKLNLQLVCTSPNFLVRFTAQIVHFTCLASGPESSFGEGEGCLESTHHLRGGKVSRGSQALRVFQPLATKTGLFSWRLRSNFFNFPVFHFLDFLPLIQWKGKKKLVCSCRKCSHLVREAIFCGVD